MPTRPASDWKNCPAADAAAPSSGFRPTSSTNCKARRRRRSAARQSAGPSVRNRQRVGERLRASRSHGRKTSTAQTFMRAAAVAGYGRTRRSRSQPAALRANAVQRIATLAIAPLGTVHCAGWRQCRGRGNHGHRSHRPPDQIARRPLVLSVVRMILESADTMDSGHSAGRVDRTNMAQPWCASVSHSASIANRLARVRRPPSVTARTDQIRSSKSLASEFAISAALAGRRRFATLASNGYSNAAGANLGKLCR